MKITIEGEPKEIADLVLELQDRHGNAEDKKTLAEVLIDLGLIQNGGIKHCSNNILENK